jgi:hypothetical protein
MLLECAGRWQLSGVQESNLDNHGKLVFRLDKCETFAAAMPFSVDLLILDEKFNQLNQQLHTK